VKQEVVEIERVYARYTARKVAIILALLAALAAVVVVVTPLGVASVGWGEVVRAILSKLPFLDVESGRRASIIVWDLRLPRIAMAIVCGMGLALSGAVMQGVLRNPLASPFTLGISSAACFGGTVAMVCGATMAGGDRYVVIASAFLFGLGALVLIYGISRRRGATPEMVILCGIALMYLFLALSSTLSVAGPAAGASFLLISGNLVQSSWETMRVTLGFLLISIPLLLKYSWDLNALALGDEVALGLGVNLRRVRVVCLVLATVIVSGIVCFTGVIGFVCLMAPYIARMMMGNDHRLIFPCSALIGALLLLGTDTLGRTIGGSFEIPVGLLITLIGVPFLIYLALGRRSYEA